MSEGVTCRLRAEVTLKDNSSLLIYQCGDLYAVCKILENGIDFKWFDTPMGMRQYLKKEYGIKVHLK